jgi:hypothetical protein
VEEAIFLALYISLNTLLVRRGDEGGPTLDSDNFEARLILWLDASPERAAVFYSRLPENKRNCVIWTRTAKEAILTLRDYFTRLESVYLEHDLDGEMPLDTRSENSGMEVVRWIEKANPIIQDELRRTQFVIHSYNMYASRQMIKRLSRRGFSVEHVPFGL